MSKVARGGGWLYTSKNDQLQEFSTSNLLPRIKQPVKGQLPPLNISYDTPRILNKDWGDRSLIEAESINSFLSTSQEYQRLSFESIRQKWKRLEEEKIDRLISSFDSRYNMKIKFRNDVKLNRPIQESNSALAAYYKLISNPLRKPCSRHKKNQQEYNQRHFETLMKPFEKTKHRSKPYFLPKLDIKSSRTSNTNSTIELLVDENDNQQEQSMCTVTVT
ncbi:unnamed protein product [Didymodactylos carnosus]|uniref:Uncharacterized protein n=1 Tax=Didymodactylos carnosus TaxID=1234261 RepID=A0A815ZR97_9BILA|nr:unnamed protein product [Didymodactylos carnosus]CAF4456186.1 unnamed protein product [Didymodactylos carnosus]